MSNRSACAPRGRDGRLGPILDRSPDPAGCSHPGNEGLSLNVHFEPCGRGRRFVSDGVLCMLCGTDSTGRLPAIDALNAACQEHGRIHQVALRLRAIVAHRREELLACAEPLPLWFWLTWEMAGEFAI